MANIVVSIDLGTSRSAWAFSMKGRAENDVIVRTPKGSLVSASGGLKTETAILLDRESGDFRAFGRSALQKFIELTEDEESLLQDGEHAPASETVLFRWFKVALCEKHGYQSIHEPVAVADGGQMRPLLHVISAALRHFKEDILAHLSSLSRTCVAVHDVTWVLTIPAIYDDFAKNFMRHAAHKAGIISTLDSSQLRLCLEPEAACLAINIKEAPRLCRPGSTIMIVDCGGGTVDITTHKVLSSNPLRLKEVLPATGGPWGSTCVDKAFKDWLRGFLGTANVDQVLHSSAFFSLMQQWEDAKTNFGGKDEDRVRLNLEEIARITGIDQSSFKDLRACFNNSQDSPAFHVGGGKFMVVLPSPVVKSFFAASIERIGTCLEDLRKNDALLDMTYVVLVGGFSSSPLVQAIAKAKFHDYPECAVISALRPDVAIVRGAVLFANNAAVFHTRKARLTYGVECSEIYKKNIPGHAENYYKHKAQPGEDGKPRIRVFSRHLTSGDDIPEGGVCQAKPYAPLWSSQTSITFDILASHMKNIMFPNEDECFKLGEVTVSLDMSVPYAKRSVLVQFAFGGTELTVTASEKTTGEKSQVLLSLVQEAEKCPL